MPSRVVSVNLGQPREIIWQGKTIRTGIFKDPVAGRVRARRTNLEGDAQADLAVHGGVDKAVYAYAWEHYAAWREELGDPALPWGAFGENLTLEGFLEDAVALGDRFRMGSAEFTVTQPRMPCAKLGAKFRSLDMVKRFLASRRSGFYLRVDREGDVGAGDDVQHHPDPHRITIHRLIALYLKEETDPSLFARAVAHPDLSEKWRTFLMKRVDEPAG
jgi:MOSC domain-containing protein YiiM